MPTSVDKSADLRSGSLRRDVCIVAALDVGLFALALACLWGTDRLKLGDGLALLGACLGVAVLGTAAAGALVRRLSACVWGILPLWVALAVWEATYSGSVDFFQWWRQGDYAEALSRLSGVVLWDLLYAGVQLVVMVPAWWLGTKLRRRQRAHDHGGG